MPQPGRGLRVAPVMWDVFARHRAGSLEAVVSRTRRRNLAVTAGVLLLLAATLAALLRYTRRAQRLAELQMEFVAGVSHELRTPLTVIHTAAYNLQGKLAANPAQVEKYGALIQRESGRLKELVEQALQFAGAQAGRVVQQLDPLSVEAAIDEAVEASRAAIEASGCVFEKEIQGGLPAVLGDPVALPRALHNVLATPPSTARKANGSACSHPWSERAAMPWWKFAWRTADPAFRRRSRTRVRPVFPRAARRQGPGARGRPGPQPGQQNRGGARGRHHGEEQPMKGTEFTVRLPLAPWRNRNVSARILLVEDEPGLVVTLSDLLTAEGYAVESASDGITGLARAGEEPFDLMVLDVMLPGKNGLDVCRELRGRGKDLAILMLTAKTQLADRVVGLKLGADDYLTKPFEPPELLARIEALLRRVKKEKLTPVARFEFGNVVADFERPKSARTVWSRPWRGRSSSCCVT